MDFGAAGPFWKNGYESVAGQIRGPYNSGFKDSLQGLLECIEFAIRERLQRLYPHRPLPERWLSGRKRRFAKSVIGYPLIRRFESCPLR